MLLDLWQEFYPWPMREKENALVNLNSKKKRKDEKGEVVMVECKSATLAEEDFSTQHIKEICSTNTWRLGFVT